ncbi:hypothetical protein RFI_06888 [Reticulomyxa filosa]|uniref:Uncharacterized protein n=1 Tax=Reticulomyxa filosa TaxID=46433 RepID=X6NY60_RETFI|nr:hypothetical protein RFI_06888 [Reticulomyxa filosa]|eukprot:ETO30232.1 hypothetical protein RFI_06888 [Reticulomyxa filosa]
MAGLPGAVAGGLAGVADEIAISSGYTNKAYIASTVLGGMGVYQKFLKPFLSERVEQINKMAGDITLSNVNEALSHDKQYQIMSDYHAGYGRLLEEVREQEELLGSAEQLVKVACEKDGTLMSADVTIAYAKEQLGNKATWIFENRFKESGEKMEAIKKSYVESQDTKANIGLAAARMFGFSDEYADVFGAMYKTGSSISTAIDSYNAIINMDAIGLMSVASAVYTLGSSAILVMPALGTSAEEVDAIETPLATSTTEAYNKEALMLEKHVQEGIGLVANAQRLAKGDHQYTLGVHMDSVEKNFQTVTGVEALKEALNNVALFSNSHMEETNKKLNLFIEQLKARNAIKDEVAVLQKLVKAGEAFTSTKEIDEEFLLGDNNYSTVVAEHAGNKSNITKHILGKSGALVREEKQGGVIETVKKSAIHYFSSLLEPKGIDVVYKEAMAGSDGEVSTFDKKINADMSLLFTEKLAKCHTNAMYEYLKFDEELKILQTKMKNCNLVYDNDYVINEVLDKVDNMLKMSVVVHALGVHLDYDKGITYGVYDNQFYGRECGYPSVSIPIFYGEFRPSFYKVGKKFF